MPESYTEIGRGKKAVFIIMTVMLLALAVEGMAHLYHYAAHGRSYRVGELGVVSDVQAQIAGQGVAHPYFGITSDWRHHPLNNMPPLLDNEQTLVVGVFGGSVAQQVRLEFRARLASLLREEEIDLLPVVIELVQGGGKQPQQVHVLAYMLAHGGEFDLVVNLDGYNDIVAPHYNVRRGVFPSFPHLWDKRVGATAADKALLGRVALLKRDQRRFKTLSEGVLGLSATVGSFVRHRFEGLETEVRRANVALLEQIGDYDVESHGPRWGWFRRDYDAGDEEDVRELAVEVWYQSSRLMATLSAAAGADYFHFLQPSQYIAGAKVLTAEEMNTAYLPGWSEENYAATYPMLARRGDALRDAGVRFFDLTQTFAKVAETVYIDTCCHVNQRGVELLAGRMLDAVKPAVLERAADLAGSRESILDAARRPEYAELLVAEDHYDVYLRDGKWLVYRRQSCEDEDTRAHFFLHTVPVDPLMLPEERASAGYDNLDFAFAEAGAFMSDGSCVAQGWLPAYDVGRVRTGQYDAAGRLWSVEFEMPELPELPGIRIEPAGDQGPS